MSLNIRGEGAAAPVPEEPSRIDQRRSELSDGVGPSVGTQKTVEFSVEQLELPTMTLVKKALEQQDPALSYENVTKFSSSLPKENGKTQLDTFKLNGEDCFQGAMTFSIEAKRKDGSSVTLSFTQMIQTTIKVPYNGDNIQTEAAMKTALFKLEGYRQHIGEPLRASLDTRVDLAAIKALEKTSFTITTNQENIQRRVTERTSDRSVTRAFEAITLTVEGKELQAETLWTQKIECPSINNRNKALDEFCQLTAKGEPIPKELLSKYGLDANTAINIVARNTQQDMESLSSSLPDTKSNIKEELKNRSDCRQESTKIVTELSSLQRSGSTEHTATERMTELIGSRDLLLKKAGDHLENAKLMHKALDGQIKELDTKISALKTFEADPKISESLEKIIDLRDSLRLEETAAEISKDIKTAQRPTAPPQPNRSSLGSPKSLQEPDDFSELLGLLEGGGEVSSRVPEERPHTPTFVGPPADLPPTTIDEYYQLRPDMDPKTESQGPPSDLPPTTIDEYYNVRPDMAPQSETSPATLLKPVQEHIKNEEAFGKKMACAALLIEKIMTHETAKGKPIDSTLNQMQASYSALKELSPKIQGKLQEAGNDQSKLKDVYTSPEFELYSRMTREITLKYSSFSQKVAGLLNQPENNDLNNELIKIIHTNGLSATGVLDIFQPAITRMSRHELTLMEVSKHIKNEDLSVVDGIIKTLKLHNKETNNRQAIQEEQKKFNTLNDKILRLKEGPDIESIRRSNRLSGQMFEKTDKKQPDELQGILDEIEVFSKSKNIKSEDIEQACINLKEGSLVRNKLKLDDSGRLESWLEKFSLNKEINDFISTSNLIMNYNKSDVEKNYTEQKFLYKGENITVSDFIDKLEKFVKKNQLPQEENVNALMGKVMELSRTRQKEGIKDTALSTRMKELVDEIGRNVTYSSVETKLNEMKEMLSELESMEKIQNNIKSIIITGGTSVKEDKKENIKKLSNDISEQISITRELNSKRKSLIEAEENKGKQPDQIPGVSEIDSKLLSIKETKLSLVDSYLSATRGLVKIKDENHLQQSGGTLEILESRITSGEEISSLQDLLKKYKKEFNGLKKDTNLEDLNKSVSNSLDKRGELSRGNEKVLVKAMITHLEGMEQSAIIDGMTKGKAIDLLKTSLKGLASEPPLSISKTIGPENLEKMQKLMTQ